ncbi:MAG TPA: methyl-accepting chemotaxis protein [Ktedonobacterales bacterium]|nr:methyl-accepting chemotaxis protein [Ktedonobacterales bacterium]
MLQRRSRLGIRAQLTLIVLLGAVLSTAATLFIADNAIRNYALQQAQSQEQDNMKIAVLVLTTQYGENYSISSDNHLVVDTPTSGKNFGGPNDTNFGKYALNDDTDYVNSVKQLIGGSVSVYQCANARGDFTQCVRISTTLQKPGSSGDVQAPRDTGAQLPANIGGHMTLGSKPREWLGIDEVNGQQYFADYSPMFNPQGQLIGVLSVGVPLDTVTTFERSTTIELLLLGIIIMIAGVILALLLASVIVNTLQRAAQQVSHASERIGSIATQQADGAAQQVWAVNAINKALQNFTEAAQDISRRSDQLAQMGNQVMQRRGEMPPGQFESLIAYMTRSVRDISQSSRQQSAQYDRMGGAMQAVIEIAEQVAGNSQQTSESAERLELIVRQLQQLVGVRRFSRSTTTTGRDAPVPAGVGMNGMNGMNGVNDMGGMDGMDGMGGMMPPQGMRSVRPMQPGGAPMQPNPDWRGGMGNPAGAGVGNNGMGGYGGEYDGYNGYGGNEGQMAPMNGGQDWRMPPMPAMPQMPQMPGQHQLPPGPPMGRMQFGDDAPPSRGPRSRGAPRDMSRDGSSQYNSWRRGDGYGPDGDDGGRR